MQYNDPEQSREEQQELILLMRRQNRLMKALLSCFLIITILSVMTAAILLPRTFRIMNQAETAVANLTAVSESLAEADLDGMIKDTRTLIQDSSAGITQTMEKLDQIEFDKLNQAISDFQATIAPLAKLFGR